MYSGIIPKFKIWNIIWNIVFASFFLLDLRLQHGQTKCITKLQKPFYSLSSKSRRLRAFVCLFIELKCQKRVLRNVANLLLRRTSWPELVFQTRSSIEAFRQTSKTWMRGGPSLGKSQSSIAAGLNQMIYSALSFSLHVCGFVPCSWLLTRKTHVHFKALSLMKVWAGNHLALAKVLLCN